MFISENNYSLLLDKAQHECLTMIKKILLITYLLLTAILQPVALFAQAEHPADHEGWKEEVLHQADNFQGKFMNMILILVLLIGFMILASWSLKRMMKSRLTQINQNSLIKVLETRQLSPKSTLYLVDIEGKTFLIGESPSSLSHLATLDAHVDYPS